MILLVGHQECVCKNSKKPDLTDAVVGEKGLETNLPIAVLNGSILKRLQPYSDGYRRPIRPCRPDFNTQRDHQQGKASMTQHGGGNIVTPERDG